METVKKIIFLHPAGADGSTILREIGPDYGVESITEVSGILSRSSKDSPHGLVVDVDGAQDESMELLKAVRSRFPKWVVVVVSEKPALAQAVASVGEGAYNYLAKPFDARTLESTLAQAFEAQEMLQGLAYLAPKLENREEGRLFSQSGEMNEIYKLVGKVANVNTPVLLRGESGTGKEVMAQAIHMNSPRKNGRFVAINCSAIPENLIESELFGHEKGAFTGAVGRKMGKFEYAQGGTIFLDEIGDISPAMQVKLLRVLQEKKFIPVGSNVELSTDARVIAATNRNLEDMMEAGTFRDDLFYRLSVLPIFLPPLRERKEDLDALVSHYVRKFAESHKKSIRGIDKEAAAILREYAWPGNIRELRNVIEHAFILETSSVITPRALPAKLVTAPATPRIERSHEPPIDEDLDFRAQKERFERDFIVRALKKYKGKINQTSFGTHIPKKTLLRKLEKYKINAADYKDPA